MRFGVVLPWVFVCITALAPSRILTHVQLGYFALTLPPCVHTTLQPTHRTHRTHCTHTHLIMLFALTLHQPALCVLLAMRAHSLTAQQPSTKVAHSTIAHAPLQDTIYEFHVIVGHLGPCQVSALCHRCCPACADFTQQPSTRIDSSGAAHASSWNLP